MLYVGTSILRSDGKCMFLKQYKNNKTLSSDLFLIDTQIRGLQKIRQGKSICNNDARAVVGRDQTHSGGLSDPVYAWEYSLAEIGYKFFTFKQNHRHDFCETVFKRSTTRRKYAQYRI